MGENNRKGPTECLTITFSGGISMNIIIAGGGDIGTTIAKKLIAENHNITIIEKSTSRKKVLQSQLDALVIQGNTVDIEVLKKAEVHKASLFLAVTDNDNINIITSQMARKLSSGKLIIITKVENSYLYFNDTLIQPAGFGIDKVIDPQELIIEKVLNLVEIPEAIEVINYAGREALLIGVKVGADFDFCGQTLSAIGQEEPLFKSIRIIAIGRNNKTIIPTGLNRILDQDKLYIVGKRADITRVLKDYFNSNQKLTSIIINGGNKISREVAKVLQKQRKKVTIIENDPDLCKQLSRELSKIHIIKGSGTDPVVLKEIQVEKACVISVTSDDEFNLISAAYAKKYHAAKTICTIKNVELISIVNLMSVIDVVLSKQILSTGEILHYCRRGNITSISPFSGIDAESLSMEATEEIPILDKPLKSITFPEGLIVGLLIRDGQVIIPTGDESIRLHDQVILFVLLDRIGDIERVLLKQFKWGR